MKDVLGNEIKVGDSVLHFKHNRTSTNCYRGTVVNVSKTTVTYEKNGKAAIGKVNFVVISETNRHLHENNPSLKSAWENYRTVFALSS